MFHSDKNKRNKCEVNVGPLSVFRTEGIPITGKVSKSAEMACLLDSEEIGIVQIKSENVSTETESKKLSYGAVSEIRLLKGIRLLPPGINS